MKLNVSIDVYKIRDKDQWVVSFCKTSKFFCGTEEKPVIGKGVSRAIRFPSPVKANDFARKQFYNMDCYNDKFCLSLNLINTGEFKCK